MILRSLLILFYSFHGQFGVFAQITQDVEETIQYVQIHTNVTIPCAEDADGISVEWQYETQYHPNMEVLENGSLFVSEAVKENKGRYKCVQGDQEPPLKLIRLVVLGPPEAPQNASIHASQVMARVTWHLHLEEDYEDVPEGPKTKFNIRYRPTHTHDWLSLPVHVAPSQGLLEINKLKPNTTYELKLWTSNVYGDSDTVYSNFTTKPAIDEIEVARVMVGDIKNFSPRVWVVAVVVTLVVINISIAALIVLYCRQQRFGRTVEEEDIELVPHIIENPGYEHLGTVLESFLSPSPSTQGAAALV